MTERPCLYCHQKPLMHSAESMTCFDPVARIWLRTTYAPDPAKSGIVPYHARSMMAQERLRTLTVDSYEAFAREQIAKDRDLDIPVDTMYETVYFSDGGLIWSI